MQINYFKVVFKYILLYVELISLPVGAIYGQ